MSIENHARFEEFWLSGPWQKRDKTNAAKRFAKSVKTEEDWRLIQLARDEYAAYCKQNAWYTPRFGGTFMTSWRDWLKRDKEPPVAVADLIIHDTEHRCELCLEAHDWTCTDALCTLEKTAPCAAWIAAYRARTRRA